MPQCFFLAHLCLYISLLQTFAKQQGTAILDDYHQRHFGSICDLTIAAAPAYGQSQVLLRWQRMILSPTSRLLKSFDFVL